MAKDSKKDLFALLRNLAVWVWGTSTLALGVGIVYIVFTGNPSGTAARLGEASGAVGSVVAASALAWSWFFQVSSQKRQQDSIREDIESIKQEIRALKGHLR